MLFVIKHFTKYTLCCRTHLTTLSHLLAVGGVTLGLGVGLASLLLVLILVLQLWSWSCIFGLIDKEDQDFEQSSVVEISKNVYCAPRCCLYIVVDRISHL